MAEPLHFTETAEFQEAVQKAATAAAAEAMAKLMADLKPASQAASVDSDNDLFAKRLATYIANLSDQRDGRKFVAPEIVEAMREARDRMHGLLLRVRERGLKPEYTVIAKTQLNEQLIEPFTQTDDRKVKATHIVWTGVPNEAMRPLNDIAKEIYAAFSDSIRGKALELNQDQRPIFLTYSGLVVNGTPPARKTVGGGEPARDFAFGDHLAVVDDSAIGDPNDPNAQHVRVLGTIADPARQNAMPGQQ